jgi:hypothetical protein
MAALSYGKPASTMTAEVFRTTIKETLYILQVTLNNV